MKKIGTLSLLIVGSMISFTNITVGAESSSSKSDIGFSAPAEGAFKVNEVADFNFGNQKISTGDEVYYLDADVNTSVQDLRGTLSGWDLQLAQVEQFKNGENELTNAQISLKDLTLDEESTANAHPTTDTIDLKPNNEAVVVMSAAKGEGGGVAIEKFGKNSVALKVPGSTIKVLGNYTTTLNWTLIDAIDNE